MTLGSSPSCYQQWRMGMVIFSCILSIFTTMTAILDEIRGLHVVPGVPCKVCVCVHLIVRIPGLKLPRYDSQAPRLWSIAAWTQKKLRHFIKSARILMEVTCIDSWDYAESSHVWYIYIRCLLGLWSSRPNSCVWILIPGIKRKWRSHGFPQKSSSKLQYIHANT